MKKYLFVAAFLCATMFSTELYAQKNVILSADNDLAHIHCLGTTTVSGPNSVVYGYKDMFNLRQTKEQYTFYSEVCISYGFVSGETGRGRILNVTDKTAQVRVTCIDGYGLANNTLVIDVKPKTFSRIIFDGNGVVNKIRCELIKLF